MEKRVVEVVEVHIDVVGGDDDGEDTEGEGGIELVGKSGFDAGLFAIGEAVRGNIALNDCLKVTHLLF